ncbi:MAG: ATP-binding protein [Myxococcota bacterium]|nr:ATP-binding protein [Myxococcota bacterium]MDW8362526.1 ATP-binding protein [Myxococcales bacterium]
MTAPVPQTDPLDVELGDVARLEDIVDRAALAEVCRNFHALFGISVRVVSRDGALIADAHHEQAICQQVNALTAGRQACASTVSEVRALDPTGGVQVHPCFTGAVYRVVGLDYQGRRIGRIVIGPYLPAETREVPQSLLRIDAGLDPDRARERLAQMPRVRAETAQRIADHLRGVVDLIVFSSHRARLASAMHVASVRESYRQLAEKTAALQTAYDRLRELDRLKSSFLATVSHELRTPLTSILGYSDMLLSGMAGEIGGEQREFVETIRAKGEQLLGLITNLLDLGKLEQGSPTLRREPVDAVALAADVVRTMAPAARRKGVELVHRVDGSVAPIEADPVRLRQVLNNLTDNAIKFTPSGGRVVVGVRATEVASSRTDGPGGVLFGVPRRAVELTVSDTGIGIPESERGRIFDAFYQVDGSSTREHGGAGLGLAIVRRLVEAHGGRIDVESKVGQGTTFRVVIPEPEIASDEG